MPNRIVVCPEPLAAAAGAAIFRAGGSAVDAALATAYAQAVVSPAMATISGTGSMNLDHAPSPRNGGIDFLDPAGSPARGGFFPGAAPCGLLLRDPVLPGPTLLR